MRTLEAIGWVSGIIVALFTLLPDLKQWGYLPITIAVVILLLTFFLSRRYKAVTSKTRKSGQRKKTADSKLDDLVQSADAFIKNWNDPSFIRTPYRRKLELKGINGDRREVREHAQLIIKKMRPVRDLQINGAEPILESLAETTGKMVDLGIRIERLFSSIKKLNNLLKSEPHILTEIISQGDNICQELTVSINSLEKLRRNL